MDQTKLFVYFFVSSGQLFLAFLFDPIFRSENVQERVRKKNVFQVSSVLFSLGFPPFSNCF